jgi:hypothetical protein
VEQKLEQKIKTWNKKEQKPPQSSTPKLPTLATAPSNTVFLLPTCSEKKINDKSRNKN